MSHFPDGWVLLTWRKIQQETGDAQSWADLNTTQGLHPSLHQEPLCCEAEALTLALLDVCHPVQGSLGLPPRASGAFWISAKLLSQGGQGVQVLGRFMKDHGQGLQLRIAASVQMIKS